AYDLKAEQLARLGRHDEALAACSPPALGDPPPLVLRGRAAWVLWARGDRSAALERMRAALAAAADYYWGWYQLANWLEATGAYRAYLGAAENLFRLAPQQPASYGNRGEARWHLGDRAGAREDFARAQALVPKYAYAG